MGIYQHSGVLRAHALNLWISEINLNKTKLFYQDQLSVGFWLTWQERMTTEWAGMLLLLWRAIAYRSVLEGKLKPIAPWPSMQQEKTGSSLWFLAPETGDTHSFNHLGCDTIHHLPQTPDFKPTYSANLRQAGSFNAYRFVHTVQWRKIHYPKSASWAEYSPQQGG